MTLVQPPVAFDMPIVDGYVLADRRQGLLGTNETGRETHVELELRAPQRFTGTPSILLSLDGEGRVDPARKTVFLAQDRCPVTDYDECGHALG